MIAMVYGPRVDIERSNPFLPAHPRELMKTGNYNHVPLIIGVTANEGIYFIGGVSTT
jgi:carboxylesterase type B